jgi:hypothetical protein
MWVSLWTGLEHRLFFPRLTDRQSRSQCSRGLRRRSSAARLLRLWVRIPPGAWIFVCCECCVLSGRDLCDGLVTSPEESYRLWRVVVCDQETSITRRLKTATGLCKIQPRWVVTPGKQTNKQTDRQNVAQVTTHTTCTRLMQTSSLCFGIVCL